MPSFWKVSILPIMLSVVVAATSGAQDPNGLQACEVDLTTPSDIARAYLSLNLATGATDTTIAKNNLQAAMKVIGDSRSVVNPVGHALMIGRILTTWLGLPNAQVMMTRGDLGYPSNPTGTVNVITTVDSLFKIVETKNPQCIPELRLRRMNMGWQNLITTAANQVNSDSLKEAKKNVLYALQLSDEAPHGHATLAGIYEREGKIDSAVAEFKKTILMADGDTSWVTFKCPAYYQMGGMLADAADSVKDKATKDSYNKQAKDAFTLGMTCTGSQAKIAEMSQIAVTQISLKAGDSAAVKGLFADMEAHPEKFSVNQLAQSGGAAAGANQNADAIKLFEAAIAGSPYHRDALYNLARLYVVDKREAMALPLLDRLMKVDPNGRANYLLAASAYTNLRNYMVVANNNFKTRSDSITSTKPADLARKKAIIDSAKTPADSASKLLFPMLNDLAMPDSLVAFMTFNEWTPSSDKATVGGYLENNTTAARTFSFTIEFLDKAGTVVTTKDVAIKDPVAAKTCPAPDANGNVRCTRTNADFTVTGMGAGIVAFRYNIIK